MVKTKVPVSNAADRSLTKPSKQTVQSRRDRHISVDLEPDQKQKIVELAEQSGLSVADYLRAMVQIAINKNAKYGMQFTEVP